MFLLAIKTKSTLLLQSFEKFARSFYCAVKFFDWSVHVLNSQYRVEVQHKNNVIIIKDDKAKKHLYYKGLHINYYFQSTWYTYCNYEIQDQACG